MIGLGIALGLIVAVLLDRIPRLAPHPPRGRVAARLLGRFPVQQRAQALASVAVVLAVLLGITLAKTPVVGPRIDTTARKAASFVTGFYQGGQPPPSTRPAHKPKQGGA
jgi:hypothetical protein